VKPAGFADAQPATPADRVQARRESAVTPVEVTFKPTPAYSEEARTLRIEGEVTLEVEFSAAGHVRVLRVVRGLGHGLDELATRAAEQIKFKPAQASGRPVDFRTTVQIVFRLT
jgi:TonB family protein